MRKELIIATFVIVAIITFSSMAFINRNKADTKNTPDAVSETTQSDVQGSDIRREDQARNQAANSTKTLPQPDMLIDQNKSYSAIIKTSEVDVTISLNAKETPKTVNNFVYLAQNNFYDDTIFHRVIKDFMIQGGDPNGDGTGGPGYTFDDEGFEGEYTKGTLAMANAGPDTNGSQFFIMHGETPLPKDYVIFGSVTEGIEVVDKIANQRVQQSPMGEMSKPISPVKVNTIEIIEE